MLKNVSRCLVAALFGGLSAMGCSTADPETEGCATGQSTPCVCDDGGSGFAVCGAEGTAGQCKCSEVARDRDASEPDGQAPVAKDAGAPPVQDAGGTGGNPAPRDAGERDTGAPDPEPTDEMDALRQACVDTINAYRATLQLPALSRASAAEESCSDEGAELDHTTKRAHGSAAAGALDCRPYFVAQNTCPDYPYGGRSGSIEDALKRCLKQMWDEGEPAVGVEKCIADYRAGNTACFLAHGHYINMASPTSRQVSCGFFDSGGKVWMNQDFR